MKKISSIIILFVFLITRMNAGEAKLDLVKLKEIGKSVKVLNKPNLKIMSGVDRGSIYFLKVKAISKRGNRVFDTFIDKQTGFVYFGSAYDKEGNPIMFPKDANVIKEGVVFSYGTGSKEIYLVTDPECPYCTKFEKAAEGKLEAYTVHVIFYPLKFHKKAPAMIEWIMQGKSDVEKKERLSQIALKGSSKYSSLMKDSKKPFKYTPSTQKVINKSLKAVQELGTRGTPTVYDANFSKVPWKTIIK